MNVSAMLENLFHRSGGGIQAVETHTPLSSTPSHNARLVGRGVIKRSLQGGRIGGMAGLVALKNLNIYLLTCQGMKSGNAIIKKF